MSPCLTAQNQVCSLSHSRPPGPQSWTLGWPPVILTGTQNTLWSHTRKDVQTVSRRRLCRAGLGPCTPILGSSASRQSLLGVQMGARRGPKSMGHSPLRPLSGTGRSCPEARPSLSSLITNWAPSRPCLLSAARCPWRPGVGMCQAAHMLGGGAPSSSRILNAWLFLCSRLPPLHPDQHLRPRTGAPSSPWAIRVGSRERGAAAGPTPFPWKAPRDLLGVVTPLHKVPTPWGCLTPGHAPGQPGTLAEGRGLCLALARWCLKKKSSCEDALSPSLHSQHRIRIQWWVVGGG